MASSEYTSEYLDWYCANVLAYLEWLGFYKTTFSTGLRLFSNLLKLLLYLFLGSISYYFVGVMGVMVLAALILPSEYGSYRQRKKHNNLLMEMRGVYEVFKTPAFSWDVAWAELNRTREMGAVWPGELYRLVEQRRSEN